MHKKVEAVISVIFRLHGGLSKGQGLGFRCCSSQSKSKKQDTAVRVVNHMILTIMSEALRMANPLIKVLILLLRLGLRTRTAATTAILSF